MSFLEVQGLRLEGLRNSGHLDDLDDLDELWHYGSLWYAMLRLCWRSIILFGEVSGAIDFEQMRGER